MAPPNATSAASTGDSAHPHARWPPIPGQWPGGEQGRADRVLTLACRNFPLAAIGSRVIVFSFVAIPRESTKRILALPLYLQVDVHRFDDVHVKQKSLNQLVAISESAQIHCDHQTCIRVWVGPCRGVSLVEVLSDAKTQSNGAKGHLHLLARNQSLEQ